MRRDLRRFMKNPEPKVELSLDDFTPKDLSKFGTGRPVIRLEDRKMKRKFSRSYHIAPKRREVLAIREKDRRKGYNHTLNPFYSIPEYREGANGLIMFAEDNICVPIYPEGSDIAVWTPMHSLPKTRHPQTNKSYRHLWESQKDELRRALIMENGRFKHSQIIFCWPRGEGKSFVVCLIQIWKFFCWPKQTIMLGANSKDQVKFVHYDIMRDMILNSKFLLAAIGDAYRNIQEKEIRLRDEAGNVQSIIRSIATSSGIVSNITGYTFSEVFDMKNHKFYVQLDGSIRNMPNAIGAIDSTVSTKDHFLYQIFDSYKKGKTKKVYFSYKFALKGIPSEYWNPNMTSDQLNDYKIKFPMGEFERYFLNTWDSVATAVFTKAHILLTSYIGSYGTYINANKTIELVTELVQIEKNIEYSRTNQEENTLDIDRSLIRMEKKELELMEVSSVYTLIDQFNYPQMASMEDLNYLSDLLDTDFSILVGLDLGDPHSGARGYARSIGCCVAKGLPGSRRNYKQYTNNGQAPEYVYFLLHLWREPTHQLNLIKNEMDRINEEYDGIDTLSSERYGAWDLPEWCEDRSIKHWIVHPSYGIQKEAMNEFYAAVVTGRFKFPELGVKGTKGLTDVLREEMGVFHHDPIKKQYGSPEKFTKYGTQDDSIYATAWALYGGRLQTAEDFRPRKGIQAFGYYVPNNDLQGQYINA